MGRERKVSIWQDREIGISERIENTTKRFETLGCETAAAANVVRGEFAKDAADSDWVSKESSSLSHASLCIDCLEFTSVEKSVPVCHVNEGFFYLISCVFELREGPARAQIVVILVDLA